jgi:hypothetical protein
MIHMDLKSDMIRREIEREEDKHKMDERISDIDAKWERLFTLFEQQKK